MRDGHVFYNGRSPMEIVLAKLMYHLSGDGSKSGGQSLGDCTFILQVQSLGDGTPIFQVQSLGEMVP